MKNFLVAVPAYGMSTFATICFAIGLSIAAPSFIATDAEAKTPGSTYCFYKTCHRVKTLAETRALIGRDHVLPTSFYDDCKFDRYNPCGLTSSGEKFHPGKADNAASPIYPDGTKLLVWSPENKRALVLRINNAGPYWGGRKLDVSRAAAEKLGFKHRGVANLKARIISAPTKADATYRKNRTYAPVPGDIGIYETVRAADAALSSLQMLASATLAPFNGRALPNELVTDDVAMPAVAVAEVKPKMPKEALADARQLASLRWPVVSGPAVAAKVARKTEAVTKTAELAESKQSPPKGLVANKSRVDSVESSLAKPVPVKKTRQASSAKSPSRTAEPSKKTVKVVAARNDVAEKSATKVVTAKVARVSKPSPAVTVSKPTVVRDAPNDMSVFSRHNPDAPRLKSKQAAIKTGWLKTSSLSAQKPRRES